MTKDQSTPQKTTAHPASTTEIIQALQPYLSTPSGLAVYIGRNDISLRREQRAFTAPRNVNVDTQRTLST